MFVYTNPFSGIIPLLLSQPTEYSNESDSKCQSINSLPWSTTPTSEHSSILDLYAPSQPYIPKTSSVLGLKPLPDWHSLLTYAGNNVKLASSSEILSVKLCQQVISLAIFTSSSPTQITPQKYISFRSLKYLKEVKSNFSTW